MAINNDKLQDPNSPANLSNNNKNLETSNQWKSKEHTPLISSLLSFMLFASQSFIKEIGSVRTAPLTNNIPTEMNEGGKDYAVNQLYSLIVALQNSESQKETALQDSLPTETTNSTSIKSRQASSISIENTTNAANVLETTDTNTTLFNTESIQLKETEQVILPESSTINLKPSCL